MNVVWCLQICLEDGVVVVLVVVVMVVVVVVALFVGARRATLPLDALCTLLCAPTAWGTLPAARAGRTCRGPV